MSVKNTGVSYARINGCSLSQHIMDMAFTFTHYGEFGWYVVWCQTYKQEPGVWRVKQEWTTKLNSPPDGPRFHTQSSECYFKEGE